MNTFAPSRGCPKSVVTLPVITAFCAWAAAPGTVSNTPSRALAIACARVMMVISLAEDDEEEKLRVRQRSDGTNTISVHVQRYRWTWTAGRTRIRVRLLKPLDWDKASHWLGPAGLIRGPTGV